MTTIITGGAGFIGSALSLHLHGAGHDVVVVDKLTYAANPASLRSIAGARFELVQDDICNASAMAELFERTRPDCVYNLAAESHVDRSITGPQLTLETNIMGTYSLLEAARRYWTKLPPSAQSRFRFVQVSTDEVYGSLGSAGLFTERTPYDPSSPYAASKAGSDHLAKAWHRTFGLPVVISNCSNNYGPRHFPEKLIPLVILNALEMKPLPIYGDGSNVRDWIYVDDHVRALQLICEKGRVGQSYNVGSRNERSNLEVVKSICDLLDEFAPSTKSRRELITFVADRPGHDRRYAIDPVKLERELGWNARETFETGIRKTVEWYLANPEWWSPLREKVYTGQRLGLLENSGS